MKILWSPEGVDISGIKTGLFSTFHIIYMIVAVVSIVVSLILIKKYVKNEKTLKLILRIAGAILLVFILINRISNTWYDWKYHHVGTTTHNPYTWLMLIPFTYCGLVSIIVGVGAMICKKNDIVMEAMIPFAVFGGITNIFMPGYIDDQYMHELRTWTSLVHHCISMWIIVLMLITDYIKPSMKRWYVFPIAMVSMNLLGLFEIYVLKFGEAMNIDQPLVAAMPVLTSWYVLSISLIAGNFVFVLLWEKFHYKKKMSEIF